jgi:hypothetical protein
MVVQCFHKVPCSDEQTCEFFFLRWDRRDGARRCAVAAMADTKAMCPAFHAANNGVMFAAKVAFLIPAGEPRLPPLFLSFKYEHTVAV